ncbi:MAG TPA: 4Fe-4S binding protein [Sedimentisphaerales bacterium]|nr:4Fe-4S binding protein [Sedimentisphaerales bacterium]
MALRNIVKIDEEKCNGCGQCAAACAEGAIQIVDGKAKLVSEVYCDGLGACIGHCPEDAITIEPRDAADFDEEATKKHLARQKKAKAASNFVCPGVAAQQLRQRTHATEPTAAANVPSQLGQWPVQLKLVSPHAPYFANADLLLVADCVPFAMGDFHSRFLKGRSIAVGCPKLDDVQFYIEKLAAILQANKLNSLSVIHMEVPCCSGLTHIARQAIAKNKIEMAFEDVTIDLHGNVSQTQTVRC